MGGVPVLIALATMGIGNGWLPDQHADVECEVQTPSDTLDQVPHSGEVTLMKPAPQSSGGSGFQLPGEVREIADDAWNQTRAGLDQAARQGQARLQREARRTIDQAGQALRESVDSSLGGATTAGNSDSLAATDRPNVSGGSRPTTAPADQRRQVPSFTGNDPTGAKANARVEGPSTEPTNTQDDSWYDLQGQTERGSPDDPPSLQRERSSPESGGRQAGPAAAGSRAERTAGGPGSQPNLSSEPSRGGTRQDADTSQRTGERRTDGTSNGDRASAGGRLGSSNDVNQPANSAGFDTPGNFGRMPNSLQNSVPQYRSGASPGDRVTSNRGESGSETDRYANGGDRGNQLRRDSTATAPQPGATNANARERTMDRPTSDFRNSNSSQVDPRLSSNEVSALPPGGWSFDANGRPIDREGFVLDRFGRRVANPAGYESTSPAEQPSRYPRRGGVSAPVSSRGYHRSVTDTGQRASGAEQSEPQASGAHAGRRYASAPPPSDRERTPAQPAAPSPSDHSTHDASTSHPNAAAGSSEPQSRANGSQQEPNRLASDPKSVAAQPLFNGLLLISFVANVYLAFWLRNLRYQFRELAAAKRIASSSSSSS